MTVALAANIIFTLAKSRQGLIEALLRDGHRVLLLAPDGPDRNDLEGLEVEHIPLRNVARSGLNPLRDLRLLREMRNIYRREKVELVLLFNIKPVIFGALAAVGTSTRVIATITGAGNVFLKQPWLQLATRLLYRIALLNVELTLFQNEDDRRQFLEGGMVRADKTGLVGGAGVDLEHFGFVPITNFRHFLYVGRLLKDKGILEFVAAARKVKAADSETRFTVVGGFDPLNVEVVDQAMLEEWQAEDIIDFVGSQADIRPFLEASTCVVLPSYREGLPRVLIEGGATGRPLLATDVPGCRAVVTKGENGFLVPVYDDDALARAMLKIIALPPQELLAMGQRARAIVEAKFDHHLVNAAYLRAVNGEI